MPAKVIIILLLSCSVSLSAQKKEAWKTTAIYTGAVVFDAVGDGLNDSGNKSWGHICNSVSISFLLFSPFILRYDQDKWWAYAVTYGSLRIALFDYTYNMTRGLPLTYMGSTSSWDRSIGNVDSGVVAVGRAVSLSIGIIIPLKYLKH